MHTFKHPKYYIELRKRNREVLRSGRGLQALKLQAASIKPQAASIKLQAASDKLPNPQAFIKFQAASIRGLDADESIVWMFHVKRYLVW